MAKFLTLRRPEEGSFNENLIHTSEVMTALDQLQVEPGEHYVLIPARLLPNGTDPSKITSPRKRARTTDPEGSQAAAAANMPIRGKRKVEALRAFAAAGERGLTDEEAERVTGRSIHQRISELVEGDYLYESGRRKIQRTGLMGRVCALTPKGRAWVEENRT